MDIGLTDTLPWGKYKGRKIADIITLDVPYLLWLRDKRAEGDKEKGYKPDIKFFSREVLTVLNEALLDPANVKWVAKSSHVVWNLEELYGDVEVTPIPMTTAEIKAELKQQDSYPEWGVF